MDSSPGTLHSTVAVSGGSWPASTRRRSYSRDTLECVQFNIATAESQAGWERKKWWHCGCKRAQRAGCEPERKKLMGSKVLNLCPTRSFKGTSAAPRLRRRACRVSGTFAHTRTRPGEIVTHSHDASIPAEYGPIAFACGHDGTVTSVTSAEMPAPITTLAFTTTTTTTPMKCPQATMATVTHKSSRASLQLTHELGAYIRWMRSRASTENSKNTINTRIVQLSLSATP
jgi:hypothetical protein